MRGSGIRPEDERDLAWGSGPDSPDTDQGLDDPPPTPERERAILDERARKLAARPGGPAIGATLQVVTFEVAEQAYGIGLETVSEVLRLEELTEVPGTPPAILGVTSVHGKMLPLVEFRRFLGLPSRGVSNLLYIVVLTGGYPEMGLLVDALGEIRSVGQDEILTPPVRIDRNARACVLGATSDGLLLLDGERLLADPRLFVSASS